MLKSSILIRNIISFKMPYILILFIFSHLILAENKITPVKISIAKSFADTGVIQALSRKFHQLHPEIDIQIYSVGSLQALDHARQQKANLIITHYPLEEKRLIQQGFVIKRTQLIESKFAVFGPSNDEFKLKEITRVTNVLKKLSENEAVFITPSARGATYSKIKELWSLTGIHPDWIGHEYAPVSSLGAMIQAAQTNGYTIADLGTYLSNKSKLPNTFIPLYQNDIALKNIYSVLVVNKKSEEAEKFYHYLISPQGQSAIQEISQQIYNAAIITPIANLDPEIIATKKSNKLKQENYYLLVGLISLAIIISLLLFALYQKKRVNELLINEQETNKENQRLQRELNQRYKMESLGQLTGGIAHDFNNLLSVILGFSALAKRYLNQSENEKLYKYIENIQTAGERSKNLISQMLAFSRSEKIIDEQLDLDPILNSSTEMLSPMLTSNITLNLNIEKNIPLILMNKTQLEQILMNLSINARHAMNNKGILTINLSYQTDMNSECNVSHKQIKGNWVVLSISDTGSGMTPEVIKKIFDPYFTTKNTGEGTGMGLSIIYRIMLNHNGAIIVESEPDKGTTFHLFFPPLVDEKQQVIN